MNRNIYQLIHSELNDIQSKVNSVDYSLISVNRRLSIYHHLDLVLTNKVEGEIIELGVYTGMTAVLMQEILNEFDSDKQIFLFDSFEGIPRSTYANEKDREGVFGNHPQGDLEKIVSENFKKRTLNQPEIIKDWIRSEQLNSQLPDKICFCHLDVDMYESTKVSLDAVFPRLQKGGIIVVDDYNHPAWKGVRAAVDEFVQSNVLIFHDLNVDSDIKDHQCLIKKS